MKARIVKMGDLRGIRIPKALLEQAGLEGEVEIIARKGCLIIGPAAKSRAGWDEAFSEMARQGDDLPVAGEVAGDHSFDREEWE